MSQLKSIEFNDDGTINMTDDTGTKFSGCYPIGNGPTVCSGDEVITVKCDVAYDVVERLKDWQKELDQRTTQQGMPETQNIKD